MLREIVFLPVFLASPASSNPAPPTTAPPGARPTGVYSFSNQGIWSGYFCVQRNFNTGE
jgi:hypothetical protein